jgi:hypothetical protein
MVIRMENHCAMERKKPPEDREKVLLQNDVWLLE